MRRYLLTAWFVIAACLGQRGDEMDSGVADGTSGTAADDAAASDTSGDDGDDGGDASTGAALYHPPGYAAAEVHGPATKLHDEDCRECHGADLKGGDTKISCDSCHDAGWRTDCTFCHGGTENATGAPPRDIDGTTDVAMLSFIAHPRHTSMYQHAPYDCTQCHRKPTDVLSDGHVFDDTDARAEVDFTMGLSPQGQWDGAGGCDTLYCHGNGVVANGSATHDMPMPSCGGCHPFPGTDNLAFASMSGQHARHVGEGIGCQECHDPVAIETHVDGEKNVLIAATGFTFSTPAMTCNGVCHLKGHFSEHW